MAKQVTTQPKDETTNMQEDPHYIPGDETNLDDGDSSSNQDGQDIEAFDFEEAMAAAVPTPSFLDPLPGLYYLRPAQIRLGNYDTDTGPVYSANIIWQVVSTVSKEPEMLAQHGGLLADNHRLGGPGMIEYEKFSIARQMKKGRDDFAQRVASLGGDFKARPLQDELDNIVATYHGEEGRCCKVKINSKQGDTGYWNIKDLKMLDLDVPVDSILAEDAAYVPWDPSVE
jgi:hypothetical protein